MAASTMSMKVTSARATVRGNAPAGQPFQRAVPRTNRRRVTVAAVNKDQSSDSQGPISKVAAGVLAATLALAPFSGPAHAGFLGELKDQATSSSARADANQRTSNLPSLTDVGNSVTGLAKEGSKQDGPIDVKATAGKISALSPDLPSSGRIGQGAQNAASDVGKAVSDNTPDLPSSGGGVGGFFQSITDKLTGGGSDATDALKDAGSNVKEQVGSNTPALPTPSEAKGDADRLANKVGGELPGPGATGNIFNQAKDALPSLPNLPDAGDLKGAASDLKNKVSFNNLPSPNEVKSKVEANTPNLPNLPSAQSVKGKIDANTPNLPSGGNFFQKIGDKLSGGADDVKSQVGSATNNLPDAGDLKGAARDLKNKVSFNLPDLPSADQVKGKVEANTPNLPNLPSADSVKGKIDANTPDLPSGGNIFQQIGDKLSGAAPNVGDVKSQVGQAASNLPSADNIGDKLKGATPDVPSFKDIPSPNQLTDKVQGAFPGVPDTNGVATKPV